MTADGIVVDISSTSASKSNDCGYHIFAELTGKSVEQLRKERAQSIIANPENFAKAIEA